MTDLDAWRLIYQRFAPDEPVPSERLAEWHVDRPQGPMATIRRSFAFGADTQRLLLLGTQGSGKTTELYHLAASQPPERRVVFVDLVGHFARIGAEGVAIERLQPWEILFLVGLGTLHMARDRGFLDADLAQVEARLAGAVGAFLGVSAAGAPKVDVAGLAKSMWAGAAGAMKPLATGAAAFGGTAVGGRPEGPPLPGSPD